MKIFALAALFTALIVNAEHVHAAPLAPAGVARLQEHPSGITLVHRKNGSLAYNSAQLRTFRPGFVNRIRPLHHVRPERPLVHIDRNRPKGPHVKRPGRPHFVPLGEDDVAPEVPAVPAARKINPDEVFGSPDFCRYWGDRGDVSGYHDHCW